MGYIPWNRSNIQHSRLASRRPLASAGTGKSDCHWHASLLTIHPWRTTREWLMKPQLPFVLQTSTWSRVVGTKTWVLPHKHREGIVASARYETNIISTNHFPENSSVLLRISHGLDSYGGRDPTVRLLTRTIPLPAWPPIGLACCGSGHQFHKSPSRQSMRGEFATRGEETRRNSLKVINLIRDAVTRHRVSSLDLSVVLYGRQAIFIQGEDLTLASSLSK
jgi:hypothetical protein